MAKFSKSLAIFLANGKIIEILIANGTKFQYFFARCQWRASLLSMANVTGKILFANVKINERLVCHWHNGLLPLSRRLSGVIANVQVLLSMAIRGLVFISSLLKSLIDFINSDVSCSFIRPNLEKLVSPSDAPKNIVSYRNIKTMCQKLKCYS